MIFYKLLVGILPNFLVKIVVPSSIQCKSVHTVGKCFFSCKKTNWITVDLDVAMLYVVEWTYLLVGVQCTMLTSIA